MERNESKAHRAGYHHGDLKAALVRAGMQMLEEVGLEKLSLRGIAARVGVSHTAPKNHFDGLRGLLSAIAAEGFRRHTAMMTEGISPDATPAERLKVAGNGYVQFAQQNPALFHLMFSPARLDHTDPELSAAGRASYAVLTGVAEGLNWTPLDGSPTPKWHTELMLWSMVHGYAHLLISGKVRTDGEAPPQMTSLMPYFAYSETP